MMRFGWFSPTATMVSKTRIPPPSRLSTADSQHLCPLSWISQFPCPQFGSVAISCVHFTGYSLRINVPICHRNVPECHQNVTRMSPSCPSIRALYCIMARWQLAYMSPCVARKSPNVAPMSSSYRPVDVISCTLGSWNTELTPNRPPLDPCLAPFTTLPTSATMYTVSIEALAKRRCLSVARCGRKEGIAQTESMKHRKVVHQWPPFVQDRPPVGQLIAVAICSIM